MIKFQTVRTHSEFWKPNSFQLSNSIEKEEMCRRPAKVEETHFNLAEPENYRHKELEALRGNSTLFLGIIFVIFVYFMVNFSGFDPGSAKSEHENSSKCPLACSRAGRNLSWICPSC
jgi:hypothetical protein